MSVATLLGPSGVTAATYGSATQVSQLGVNAQGLVTSATNVAINFPVVSVAGKTGAVTLNNTDIAGLGSAAVKNFGTTVGDLVEVQSSSRLPALDGSQLTSVNASALQSRPVASAAPTDAQVLTWNNVTSVWEPRTPLVASSLLASDGSAASPSISFQNSNTSGFYRPSANTIGVSIAGTSSYQFAGNGFYSSTNFGPNLSPGTSAAIPAYSFVGDPDTGMYRTAADTLAFSTASGERMRIDLNGNLAVGSTSTAYRLNVDAGTGGGNLTAGIFRASRSAGTVSLAIGNSNGTSRSSELTFKGGAGLIDRFGIGIDSTQSNSNDFYIYDYVGATRLLINSAGNVGIGTTSPQSLLHVNGTVTSVTGTAPISVSNNTTTPVISMTQANTTNDGFVSSADWNTFNDKLSSNLLNMRIFVGNGANVATGVQMSGDTTIDNTGLVTIANDAIGSAEVSDLSIGTIDLGDGIVTTAKINDGNVTLAKLAGDSVNSSKIVDGSIAASDFSSAVGVWASDGTNVYRSSGNVGIGTAAPSSALVVGGNFSSQSQHHRCHCI